METKTIMSSIEKRPWGRFERFALNEKCTVKLVYVEGDKRLSLQYHNNRIEFWKVVKGPVIVQLGRSVDKLETKTLKTEEYVTIEKRMLHRLIGAGEEGMILEISRGEFDENDIVRLDDDYNRLEKL